MATVHRSPLRLLDPLAIVLRVGLTVHEARLMAAIAGVAPSRSRERAADTVSAVLPPEVVARVDWSTLHRESASVVDPELRERQSDLLFSARLHGGQPPLLYFLLEHQSSVDRWMTFRMLRYVVRQLEHWRQQHLDSEALPVIIPVVNVLNSVAGEQRAEELMKTMGDVLIEQGHARGLAEGVAKGRNEGLAEGQAKGRAEGVLRILAARGIAVDETARKLILSCTDLNTLDQWLDRALSATSLSDLMMNG